jgi:hypothetical protein
VKQRILSFKQDETKDWYVELACGHTRHMRHNPPWVNRPWVEIVEKREQYLGSQLDCQKCEQEMSNEIDTL